VNDKGCNSVKRSALRDGFLKAALCRGHRDARSCPRIRMRAKRETRKARAKGTERELIKILNILNIRPVILFGALFIRLRRTGKPRCATLHACPRYVRSIGKSSLLAFHFEILICMMSACAPKLRSVIRDVNIVSDIASFFSGDFRVIPSRENATKETRENMHVLLLCFLHLLFFFFALRASFCYNATSDYSRLVFSYMSLRFLFSFKSTFCLAFSFWEISRKSQMKR